MKSIQTVLFSLFLFGLAMPQSSPAASGKACAGITILHSFGAFPNGANPQAPLVLGKDGNFYGTTYNGGTNGGLNHGNGTVFRITPGGALTSLYSFTGGDDGANPTSLVWGKDGNLYGGANGGGASNNGTIFRITPKGNFTVLYSFTGGEDGSGPTVLAQGKDNKFYGSTSSTLFRMTPTGALTSLASISANSLALGRDGEFYGTTFGGGDDGYGTVFKITSGGAVKTLYTFGGGADGWEPNGLVQGSNGDFYGTTAWGGINGFFGFGTVFKITPNGAFATLYSFTNGADGSTPQATLTQGRDGNLYGTAFGGETNWDGTFFRITPKGAFTILYSGPGDLNSVSALVLGNDGNFYATMSGSFAYVVPAMAASAGTRSNRAAAVGKSDGSSSGLNPPTRGTVLEISPEGKFTNLYSFTCTDEGGGPDGSFFRGSDGNFYGTTSGGEGGNVLASVFKVMPGGAFSITYAFQGGFYGPSLTLVQGHDGSFYGTESSVGPLNPAGVNVFKITPGGQFTNLYSFGEFGGYPAAAVVQGGDGDLYGTTYTGGSNNNGTVFRITTNGGFANLYSFTNGNDGANPATALVQGRDGGFYGSTASGGSNNEGTIFRITPDGEFASLYSFTNKAQFENPSSALALGKDGKFYGSTYSGGSDDEGTIFKITTNGVLTSLYSFTNGTDGANPPSALVLGSDGNFYGFTPGGGADGYGVIFEITPDGAFTSLYSFPGGEGGANVNSLAQGGDGNFYGTTSGGGAGGNGTLFRLPIPLPPLAPFITREPPGQLHEPAGSVLTLGATVEGMPPLSYQWRRNGVDLSEGENISGSTSGALTISPLMLTNSGTYRFIVSNSYGAVTSAVTVLAVSADKVPPTILFSSPAPGARTNSGLISGAVTDNAQVVAVDYWLTNYNNGVTGTAGQAVLGFGTTNRTWSIPGAPLPGSNSVTVQSVDFTGNKSSMPARAFFYEVPSLFTLTRTGNGAVAGTASIRGDLPPTNGAMLHIGESYTLVATPAKNWLFRNWTGADSVVSSSATLRFIMENGATFQANFVTNQFSRMVGTYNGLFYSDSIGATEETAGMIADLTVGAKGAYTGKLLLAGTKYTLAGTFDPTTGQATNQVARSAAAGGAIEVELALQWNNYPLREITGAVIGTNAVAIAGTNAEGWTSSDLALYANLANSGIDAKAYTMLIPHVEVNEVYFSLPAYGYGLLANHAGAVTIAGALADGTPISQTVPIGEDNGIPIYASLYKGTGLLFGRLALGASGAVPAGNLTWIQKTYLVGFGGPPGQPVPALQGPPKEHPEGFIIVFGFTNITAVQGSPWTNAPKVSVIIQPNSELILSGDGLGSPLTNTVSVTSANTLRRTSGATNFVSGSINPKTGLLNLAFFDAEGNKVTCQGAVIQNAGVAGGFYLVGSAGSITLQRP